MLGIITDYGYKDVYAGILRIVAKSTCPSAELVDVTHGIDPFNVLSGAVATLVTLPHMPPSSVLVVVVDPGVGSSREPVVAEIGDWYVVAPNNGVLHLAAEEYGLKKIYRITKKVSNYESATFHGRDIFVPAGALIECGRKPSELGEPTTLVTLNMALTREVLEGVVKTTVIYIDHFGNVMTWIKDNPFRLGTRILINRSYEAKVVRSFSDVNPGELAVYVNSFGYLEIAKYMGSAADELRLNVGERVILEAKDS